MLDILLLILTIIGIIILSIIAVILAILGIYVIYVFIKEIIKKEQEQKITSYSTKFDKNINKNIL